MTQRQSDKHSPRVDDQLEHETASVTQGAPTPSASRDDRRQEDPAEDTGASAGPAPATPAGTTLTGVELRSALAQSLRPGAFPADRDRLVRVAEDEGAAPEVLGRLRGLPEGRRFLVLEEVYETLGGPGEDHTHRA